MRADVITGDAFDVVPTIAPMTDVFTSLPDAAEVDMDLWKWREFFRRSVRLVLDHTDPDGFAIFYQTDRRANRGILSKAGIVVDEAEASGMRVVWHKIAVRTRGTSLFRPAYSHLIAVSRNGGAGKATPDVFDVGPRAYKDGADEASLDVAFDLLAAHDATHVVDPFAGRGSTAVAAWARGMSSTSVEVVPEIADDARARIAAAMA